MKGESRMQDLYRDLRDKRLLPVIAVLVVALVAVPVLLGAGAAEAPQDTSASSSAAGDGSLDAPEARAVVVEQPPEIRDFNKRLDGFPSKNPFRQQLRGPSKEQQQQLQDPGSTATDGGGTGGDTAAGGGSGSPAGSAQPSVTVENFIYTYEIDVKVGLVGNTKKREGVEAFSYLPGAKRPVVQYVSSNFDATEAFFVVSPNVGATEGDGVCAPSKKNCSFLLMKDGDEHKFEYRRDGRTYRLKVTNIKRVTTKVDEDTASEAAAAFDELKAGK